MPVERSKILVVDDEPENVRLLQRALRRQYEVLSSTSGKEAVEHMQKNPDIALVLTDQRMPGMTGVDILRESLNHCPHAVRVVLTGYTELQDVLDAINLGQVNRFVLKPLDPDKLINLITDSLEVYVLARERNFLLVELERRNKRLEEHEKELERLVAERTAELQVRNRELKKANDELQVANERLSELALRDGQT
jgi:response regulator RpfG family c-di-GMP phosphodiesterase